MSILWTLGGLLVCSGLVTIWMILRGELPEAPPDLPELLDTPARSSNEQVKDLGSGRPGDVPYGG